MTKATIAYFTDEYSPKANTFATFDAIAHISGKLTEEGLVYLDDYELSSVDYRYDGRQVITMKFRSEELAMLVKLRGIDNG
jgi:hypothetical protein